MSLRYLCGGSILGQDAGIVSSPAQGLLPPPHARAEDLVHLRQRKPQAALPDALQAIATKHAQNEHRRSPDGNGTKSAVAYAAQRGTLSFRCAYRSSSSLGEPR